MDKDFQRDEWLKNCRIFQNKSSQFTKYVFYINTADLINYGHFSIDTPRVALEPSHLATPRKVCDG